MQEVTLSIRFIQPCLGAVQASDDRHHGLFCMHRTPDGKVMFLPSWWRTIACFAAKVLNRPVELVGQIDWAPAVEGRLGRWKRYLEPEARSRRPRYAMHEAFLAGELLSVQCVLPDGLGPNDLHSLMEVAGQYKGISPFRPGSFGTFGAVSVEPLRRAPILVETTV